MKDHPDAATETQEYIPPTWFEELGSSLSIRAQYVLSGNLRDLFPLPGENGPNFVSFECALWHVLGARGFGALLLHDPVDGLRLHYECDPRYEEALNDCGIEIGTVASTPEALAALARAVATEDRLPIALVLDYASMLSRTPSAATEKLFVAMDKLSRAPRPERPDNGVDYPPRNPILWLVERPGDLPEWFAAGNPALRDIAIALPDLGDRFAFAQQLVLRLDGEGIHDEAELHKRTEQFAVRCEGMSLIEMRDIVDLSVAEGFPLTRIADALRSYRIGTTRNPWTSTVMRSRIKNAMDLLDKRVKGQPRALERTYDILVRSVMGLSGAQTSARGNRPRGVLFFVGPTGVGKTELAKAVTEVLFGDETAMQRFDMSEFMGQDSIGRLIGPPPGAPGHENGGELVNTVRARPFSVFLFDEIEKGHPRILDAFLQILDDGRLSDTRGETGYFSEALIIFTSNVGIIGGDRSNNMGQSIVPADTHEVLEQKLTQAVGNHFRYELKRPELMNRMGQNIVAFEFIHPTSGEVIFNAVLGRVIAAVREEHGVAITLTDGAKAQLLELCTGELGDGGRGIGNRIESNFINPLSRLLFQREGTGELTIHGVREQGRETVLECE